MEKTIVLNSNAEGKLLVGSDMYFLKDESRKTFKTENLEAFEKFLGIAQAQPPVGGLEIYFNLKDGVYLVPVEASKNSRALAFCALNLSMPLLALQKSVGVSMGIVDFEKLLTGLRKYAVGSHLNTVSQLRNFSVAKKQSYARDIDNQGNFRLLIQKEAVAEAGSWVPPPALSFALPVFTYLKEQFTVELDLVFSVGDAGVPIFRLENLGFQDELEARAREVLEARIATAATVPTFWGVSEVHKLDDAWKYQQNKATL